MRPSLRTLSFVAIGTFFTTSFLFAGGFQLNEHGIRAIGMGGAFVARAIDPSAIYFNPAGLAFQVRNQMSAGGTFIIPNTSFYGPAQFLSNQKTEMVKQIFTPFFAYGTYHLSEDLHFGLGVYTPFGLGTKWPENWPGKFISTQVDLQSFSFNPTIAYKVSEQLSVGIGLNYVVGNVTIKRVVSDPFDPHADLTMNLDGNSFGFNAGALFRPAPDFSVGVSYRSGVSISATGTADFAPNRSVYPEGDVSSSLRLPSTAYAGIAYSPVSDFVMEFDYQFVGWSSFQELVFTFKKDGSTSRSPKKYQDTFILRVGGEYSLGDLELRAGYLYDHTPVQTSYVEPLLPDANRHGLNVGAGYRLNEALTLEMSYMFLIFEQRKAEGTAISFDGTYSTRASLVSIGLTYSL